MQLATEKMKRMPLTNRLNLPQPIYSAVVNDAYDRGDTLSVTQLIAPPRKVVLEERHSHEITEDVADRIWSLIGQVAHGILERADKTGMAERRFSTQIEGHTISGQVDRFHDGILQDYKVQTVYRFKGGKHPEEIEEQLNCYAEILRSNGHEVKGLQCVAILRDWSKGQAKREEGYPTEQVMVIDIPLWPAELAHSFLTERVRAYLSAKETLPDCTDDERWARPPVFAVMKPGRKSAVRLHDTREQAEAMISDLGNGHYLQIRLGENIRCESYCSAAPFCEQFQALQKARLGVVDSLTSETGAAGVVA